MGDQLIGKRVSVTLHSQVRYEGRLKQVHMETTAVSISDVRCCGTEGRKAAQGLPNEEKPPLPNIFPSVLFPAMDIEGLNIIEEDQFQAPPPQPNQYAAPAAQMAPPGQQAQNYGGAPAQNVPQGYQGYNNQQPALQQQAQQQQQQQQQAPQQQQQQPAPPAQRQPQQAPQQQAPQQQAAPQRRAQAQPARPAANVRPAQDKPAAAGTPATGAAPTMNVMRRGGDGGGEGGRGGRGGRGTAGGRAVPAWGRPAAVEQAGAGAAPRAPAGAQRQPVQAPPPTAGAPPTPAAPAPRVPPVNWAAAAAGGVRGGAQAGRGGGRGGPAPGRGARARAPPTNYTPGVPVADPNAGAQTKPDYDYANITELFDKDKAAMQEAAAAAAAAPPRAVDPEDSFFDALSCDALEKRGLIQPVMRPDMKAQYAINMETFGAIKSNTHHLQAYGRGRGRGGGGGGHYGGQHLPAIGETAAGGGGGAPRNPNAHWNEGRRGPGAGAGTRPGQSGATAGRGGGDRDGDRRSGGRGYQGRPENAHGGRGRGGRGGGGRGRGRDAGTAVAAR